MTSNLGVSALKAKSLGFTLSETIEGDYKEYKDKILTLAKKTLKPEFINRLDEVVVFHHGAFLTKEKDSKRGNYIVTGQLPPQFLNAGTYRFNLIFGENQRFGLWWKSDVVMFEVENEIFGTNSKILPGVVRPDITYSINRP
jgi:hypothetical protein